MYDTAGYEKNWRIVTFDDIYVLMSAPGQWSTARSTWKERKEDT